MKRTIKIVVIVLAILLLAYIGLKLSVVISVNSRIADLPDFKVQEVQTVKAEFENSEKVNGITFDLKYGLKPQESDTFITYKNDDETISLFIANTTDNDVDINSGKEYVTDYSYISSLFINDKAYDNYIKKQGIKSFGELSVSTVKDTKKLSLVTALYPLPLYKQELTRTILKNTLVPVTVDTVYVTDSDDYDIVIFKCDNTYYYNAYAKNDISSYALILGNKANVLSDQEVINYLMSVELE